MKTLKPFNLQKALSGKAVKLRNGEKAYVRHYESELPVSDSQELFGYRANGKRITWGLKGNFFPDSSESSLDIMGMYLETHFINGYEVPAPEASPPGLGMACYVPSILSAYLYEKVIYGRVEDTLERWLSRGLVFLDKEDAIATAKAMLGIHPYSED